MNDICRRLTSRFGLIPVMLVVLATGCSGGGGLDPILGTPPIGVVIPVADVTRPTVTLTVPTAGATLAPNNTKLTATFSEDMAPGSLSGASFSVMNTTLGTAVVGTVSYSAAARTAIFTPTAPSTLANTSSFTATITTAATDVAGNALAGNTAVLPSAGNHVWTFTTSAVGDTAPPTVATINPADSAGNVCRTEVIHASFNEPMDPTTISDTTFRVTQGGIAVLGIVTYDAVSQSASFTANSPTGFAASTGFSATLASGASGVKDLAGNSLAADRVWSFTTGTQACNSDTTRPTATLTMPATGATLVPNNTKITATFSEDMAPGTFSGASFSVMNTTLGSAVVGTVSYSAAARTATFTPTTPSTLANNNAFTATITTAVTDVAGNALAGNTAVLPSAGNHVWTFNTSAAGDATAPTVATIHPADGATSVCRTKVVNASFNEAMDPATLSDTTFRVTQGGVSVLGTVTYDAVNRIASFTADSPTGFAASTLFSATVASGASGVKDLAGNPLAADRVWSFTTGTQACANAVNLRTAASFGAFGGGAGITNHGVNSVVAGNLGTTAACTLITGFHDASNTYSETPLDVGVVNGNINCAPPAPGTATSMAIATQARADALTAYNELAAMPPGSDPGAGQLGGLVLAPAVYTSAGGTFAITTGDLTLDAQGDANAVWVFQSAAALTVGLSATPRQVRLINGAQARNVFWKVGSAARIENGSTMVGTIIAPAGVTISTMGQTAQTTLIGRAIGLTASVTMVNTTIVAP